MDLQSRFLQDFAKRATEDKGERNDQCMPTQSNPYTKTASTPWHEEAEHMGIDQSCNLSSLNQSAEFTTVANKKEARKEANKKRAIRSDSAFN